MSEKAPKKKAQAKKEAPKKAAKAKKVKVAKKEETEEKKVVVQKVSLGPSPRPMVISRHGNDMDEREGRGFSFSELDSAGVWRVDVKRLHIPLDIRRRTTLDANVERLKGWYKAPEHKPAHVAAEKPASKAAPKKGKKSKKAAGTKKE
jgi:ribosomal protein L13E